MVIEFLNKKEKREPAYGLHILVVVYALTLLVFLSFESQPLPVLVSSVFLLALLVAVTYIDAKLMRIPNWLTIAMFFAGLCIHAFLHADQLVYYSAAGFAAFLFMICVAELYRLVRKQEGLGMGDAKLFAASGAWVGFIGLPSVLLYASVTALIVILITAVIRRHLPTQKRFPFGPHICFGTWLVWLLGPLQ